jgi:hypothetical protein
MWVGYLRIGLIMMKWMRLNVTRVLGQKVVGTSSKRGLHQRSVKQMENVKIVFTSFNSRDLLALLVE